MPAAELIQFAEKVTDLHGCCVENPPGSSSPSLLCRSQATVESRTDDTGDRCPALACDRANPLVTLIIDEDVQPMRHHAHTLACPYLQAGVRQGRGTQPDVLAPLTESPSRGLLRSADLCCVHRAA